MVPTKENEDFSVNTLKIYEEEWKKELYDQDLGPSKKLQNLLFQPGQLDPLMKQIIDWAKQDKEALNAMTALMAHHISGKEMFNILFAKLMGPLAAGTKRKRRKKKTKEN